MLVGPIDCCDEYWLLYCLILGDFDRLEGGADIFEYCDIFDPADIPGG